MNDPDLPSIHPITLPTPFPVGPVNTYLVRGDALVLVDTGPKSDAAYHALCAGLAELRIEPPDLDAIIVTHGHIDHIGLLRTLVETSGATTYGHPFVASQWTYGEAKAAQRQAYFSQLFATYGAPEDETDTCITHWNSYRSFTDEVSLQHTIDQGDSVFGFGVHHLPGHSPSDLVLVDDRRGVAITGDHLLPAISPNPLVRKPLPGQPKAKSLVEYRASLRRCRQLDLDWCFPGHGEPFREHRQVIDGLLARHDKRTGHVLALLRGAPRTPYEVSRALFPTLEIKFLYLGISAAIGHLEVLEEEGRARAYLDGAVMRYYVST